MSARWTVAVIVAGMLALCSGRARAGERGEKEARAHFQKAESAFNLGKFDEALTGYEAAYEAKPLPGFLFNIAQCYRNLGNSERARFFYQRYLALEPSTPNRKMVEDLVAEMDRQLEQQKIHEAETAPRRVPALPLPSTEPALLTSSAQAEPARKPITRTWWFWTGVGVVVAGAVVTTLLVTRSPENPTGSLGSIDLR